MIDSAAVLLLVFLLCYWHWRQSPLLPATTPREFYPVRNKYLCQNTLHRRKPEWVIEAILRLKAWTPKAGCRRIAEAFNRKNEADGFTVSMSFVAKVIINNGHKLLKLRQSLNGQSRTLHQPDRNDTWAMDMTTVTGADKKQRLLLGLIDHGTRLCVHLNELSDKRAITIWRHLIKAFRQYGIPKRIKVDNERSFNAGWLVFALAMLGVAIQTTDPHSPWQNGKIERFFRSFKNDWRKVIAGDLQTLLDQWRWMYNFARPHIGVDYRTPAEAWMGKPRTLGTGGRISLWNGALRAYYFPD